MKVMVVGKMMVEVVVVVRLLKLGLKVVVGEWWWGGRSGGGCGGGRVVEGEGGP